VNVRLGIDLLSGDYEISSPEFHLCRHRLHK